MKTQHPASLSVILAILVAVQGLSQLGLGQNQQKPADPVSAGAATPSPQNQSTPQQAGLALADLEQMALSNNPTLAQAAAEIRAASARKLQAGLYPNPTVGYQGEQIRGDIQGGGEQGFFISQNIVLGRRLGLRREVAGPEGKQPRADG